MAALADRLATATTALEGPAALAGRGPAVPSLELDLAQARAEAALFGDAAAVKVGRYTLIERAGSGGMGVVWSAWDPELGRGVAIKLASSGDEAARSRARDEGRALAKLSHPNVVPIYDVLEHDDRVFLVMELVKGRTLRAAAEGQSVGQIVRAYRQAGEGLAAAHHAGLVHRDFKPDNAILGADGRVRVLDFGLASASGSDPGSIAGTPRYMAPEQREHQPLTAAVDQYGLSVALRETLAERGPVPRWLQPIIARGTAEAPGDRFGSMDELVRALARDPASRWRRRAVVVVGVLVIGGLIGAFSLGRAQQVESPCEGGPALMAASWGDGRRATIAAHLGGLGTAYAADAVPRVLGALDRYRQGWLELHRGACQAHRRGEISSELLDRRAACLTRRRAALTAVAELAELTSAEALPGLVAATGELPALATCADDETLLARVAPPPASAAREVAAIVDVLARVDVQRDAGRVDEAARDGDLAVTMADTLGYAPLAARAHLARGRVSTVADRDEELGADDFGTSLRAALAVGDDLLAIEAYARRTYAIGRTATATSAPDGLELIEALGTRVGDQGHFVRALLYNNLGTFESARGDRAATLSAYTRARAEAAAVDGDGAIELTVIPMNMLLLVDDAAARAQLADEVVATRTRLLGALHPLTLEARAYAANSLDELDASRRAMAPVVDELARYHPALGAELANAAFGLLWSTQLAGDAAAVLALADRVDAAAAHGAGAPMVAVAAAYRHLASGAVREARADFAALIAGSPGEADAPWWVQKRTADLLLGAAMAALAAADAPAARLALDGAAARYRRIAAQLPAPARHQRDAALAQLRARVE